MPTRGSQARADDRGTSRSSKFRARTRSALTPPSEQSIRYILQHDQQQMQMMGQVHVHHQAQQQGPVPGGSLVLMVKGKGAGN